MYAGPALFAERRPVLPASGDGAPQTWHFDVGRGHAGHVHDGLLAARYFVLRGRGATLQTSQFGNLQASHW